MKSIKKILVILLAVIIMLQAFPFYLFAVNATDEISEDKEVETVEKTNIDEKQEETKQIDENIEENNDVNDIEESNEENSIQTMSLENEKAQAYSVQTIATQTLSNGIYSIKTALNTNYVLDVEGASTDKCANILIYPNNLANNQKFYINNIGNGYYTITAIHSNCLLDVANGGKVSGSNVWQYGSNDTDAQKWTIKDAGNGYYNIISKLNGLYLDVQGGKAASCANIQVNSANGSTSQKFKLELINNEKGTKTINDGTYTIQTAMSSNYVLDVEGASTAQCANVLLYQKQNSDNQKFKITYVGDGYYTLMAIHSNKLLDVANGGKISGSNIWQYGANNTDAQKWIIKDAGDGYFYIISKLNGLYLDVQGGKAASCANIQVNNPNKTQSQKFKFDEVKTTTQENRVIKDGIYSIETAVSSDYVLDVAGGSRAKCANIQIYKKQATTRQKFKVTYVGNDYYTITSVHSDKLLDVANGGKVPETNVWQYDDNDTDAQKWQIKDAGNGYYYIISKLNGLYLDVYGCIAQNGQNVEVYGHNTSNAQKFKFVEPINVLDTINTSKYPGYKEKIANLINKHPNWNFELLYTGLKFENVISGEASLHSRNLVPTSYGGEWICSVCGTKLYDSGWYCASEKATAYYMDPRNFLDESNVFQFQELNEYIEGVCSLQGIQKEVNGTFLQNYASAIDNACRNQNVNAYYIITRVIQEQGRNGTAIGKGMDGGDGKTYYNPFDIGASGNGYDQIYANALARAKREGWDTMQKALEGGIVFCKENWLENYQNTLYQNKFDIDTRNGTSLYTHQYMQNLMAAYSEAILLKGMYADTGKLDSNFTFIIPMYENMSQTISQMPTNKSESSIINVQITANGGLWLREEASTSSDTIRLIPQGEVVLSVQRGINSNWHKVILTDGKIGYMSGTYLKQVADVTNCSYTARVKTNDGSGCYVRIGPSLSLDKITALVEGTAVTVINEGTYNNIDGFNWVRIRLSDGRQAFMPSKYLAR